LPNDVSLDFERPLAELEKKIEELQRFESEKGVDLSSEIEVLRRRADQLGVEIFDNLTRWQRVQLARHPKRPLALDYIGLIIDDFIELHGDRCFRDDKAIVGGIGSFEGHPVTVVAEQKGKDTKENLLRTFGYPYPEGYRKALRLMKQAEKFKRPIICFADTPGAYPGVEGEERGVAQAIAQNLLEMSRMTVPIIVVVIGEGGSGGALGIGVGNRVLMLENAYYSVITPESCAAILWRDSSKAAEAAEALKLTAKDLLSLGVIDEIISEPLGGAHKNPDVTAANVKDAISRHLTELRLMSPEELAEHRYRKFRSMGQFIEN
jgi:acetyl-CoA carboxylase carboxyl transferase subunit alpha